MEALGYQDRLADRGQKGGAADALPYPGVAVVRCPDSQTYCDRHVDSVEEAKADFKFQSVEEGE